MCQTSRCWCDPEVEEDLEWITIVGPGSWSVDIRLLEELILPMELKDDPSSWLNMAGTVSLARPEKSLESQKTESIKYLVEHVIMYRVSNIKVPFLFFFLCLDTFEFLLKLIIVWSITNGKIIPDVQN